MEEKIIINIQIINYFTLSLVCVLGRMLYIYREENFSIFQIRFIVLGFFLFHISFSRDFPFNLRCFMDYYGRLLLKCFLFFSFQSLIPLSDLRPWQTCVNLLSEYFLGLFIQLRGFFSWGLFMKNLLLLISSLEKWASTFHFYLNTIFQYLKSFLLRTFGTFQ